MDFLNINETVQSVIRISKGVAREYGNASYAPAHLLFALMHKEVGLRSFVESLGKDADYLREWAEVRIEEYPKAAGAGEIMPDPKVTNCLSKPIMYESSGDCWKSIHFACWQPLLHPKQVSVRTSCARSLFGSVRYMTSSRAEWVI